MPETVRVIEELGIIEVTSVGDLDQEEMGRSLAQCVELRLFRELKCVLVDARQVGSVLSAMPMFEFANAVAAQAVLQDVRFAIITPPDPPEDLQLLENAARNRGVRLQLFDARQPALAWLKATDSRS